MRVEHHILRGTAALAICAFVANYTFAADGGALQRYAISGTAALQLDAPVQSGGSLRLRATLAPTSVQTQQPTLLAGNRFALSATLAVDKPGICYSDTIFRDDFDADGF